jgi:hypothetical protein
MSSEAPAMLVEGTLSGGQDPLPLEGSALVLDGVVNALERYVTQASQSWATRYSRTRPGGYELALELVRSRAAVTDGRVTVEMDARVTLRGAAGRVYLGQTSVHGKQTETTSSDRADAVAGECLEEVARQVAGWLEGVQP